MVFLLDGSIHPSEVKLQALRELEQRMIRGIKFEDISYQDVSDSISFHEMLLRDYEKLRKPAVLV